MKKLLLSVFFGLLIAHSFASSFALAFDTDCDSNSVILDFTVQIPAQQGSNLLWTNDGLTQLHKNQEALFVSHPQLIPLNRKEEFQTFAAQLNMIDYDSTMLSISVRFSNDGSVWENWQLLEPNHEGIYSDTALTSTLLFLPVEVQFFQFMLEFHASFTGLAPPRVRQIRFDSFSPLNTPPIGPDQALTFNLPGSNEDCGCPLPAFATRTNWNSPDGQNPSCSSPAYSPVSHMIVHHSYTSNTSSNWAATVLSIWNYHVNSNGWCDIGYNWLIDPDGVVYEGRGGGNNVRGAHFCATNTGTMGICMLGTYMDTAPTPEALASLEALLTWKSCDSDIDPVASSFHTSSGKNLPHIAGHRDGCNTLCPGDQLYDLLPNVRQKVEVELAICDSLTTDIEAELLPEISVFPNPNSGAFVVSWEGKRSEKSSLSLHNSLGEMVLHKEVMVSSGDNLIPIQSHSLSQGVYLLRLHSQIGTFARRIVIRK